MIEVFVEKTPVIFGHELKHTIIPTVMKMMESLKHQLDNQFNQKTNQTDLFLKDSITGIVANHVRKYL